MEELLKNCSKITGPGIAIASAYHSQEHAVFAPSAKPTKFPYQRHI